MYLIFCCACCATLSPARSHRFLLNTGGEKHASRATSFPMRSDDADDPRIIALMTMWLPQHCRNRPSMCHGVYRNQGYHNSTLSSINEPHGSGLFPLHKPCYWPLNEDPIDFTGVCSFNHPTFKRRNARQMGRQTLKTIAIEKDGIAEIGSFGKSLTCKLLSFGCLRWVFPLLVSCDGHK